MTITENQRRTLDLMAESIGWSWTDVEQLSRAAFEEDVAGLSWRQANDLMGYVPTGERTGGVCDYVAERTEENAVPCTRCGAPSWDVGYDVLLCDKHVAIMDAGYNEALKRAWQPAMVTRGSDDEFPF